jgi:hypothetical protein
MPVLLTFSQQFQYSGLQLPHSYLPDHCKSEFKIEVYSRSLRLNMYLAIHCTVATDLMDSCDLTSFTLSQMYVA